MGIVEFGEEQRAAVIGPGQTAIAAVEGQGGYIACGQILDVQGVDFVPAGVQAIGQQAMVGTNVERPQRKKAAACQGVGVQQQLLLAFIDRVGIIARAWAAVMAGVFIASGGTGVVQVGPPWRRQGQIGFLDAALDLLEQLLAQRGLMSQTGLLVGVFRFEVGQYLGLVTLLQPRIGIGRVVGSGQGRQVGAWHRISLGS